MMNRFIAYNMPKVELHCHLDGSMSVELTQKLLSEMGEEYTKEELAEALTAPMDCQSLADYLKRFELPIRCLQTKEGLRAAAEELALRAAKEQVKYLEVRFAPSFSTQQGLSIRNVIESVCEGLKQAEAQRDIHTGVLVCAMRNLDTETNLFMLKEAREFLGAGVVGCDLAGDEKAYPTSDFADLFEMARKYEMPFTIHAGECGSTLDIQTAIEYGARRIGHGIAMKKDVELMKFCADKKIGVELCPTSNLQTKAINSMEEYPFTKFYEAGIPMSINTDNRTVSDTTCTDEYMRLTEAGMFKEAMCQKIYMSSIATSFADDSVKQEVFSRWPIVL